LIVDLSGDIGRAAWNLIFKLAVSKEYLEKTKMVFKKEAECWEDLFKFRDQCESIYLLYLVQSVIGDSSDAELAEIRKEPSPEERTALRLDILNSKAILHAIKYIRSLEGYAIQDVAIFYIRMTLKIITAYVVESIKSNKRIPSEFKLYEYKIIKEDTKPIIRKPNNIPISNPSLKSHRSGICRSID